MMPNPTLPIIETFLTGEEGQRISFSDTLNPSSPGFLPVWLLILGVAAAIIIIWRQGVVEERADQEKFEAEDKDKYK